MNYLTCPITPYAYQSWDVSKVENAVSVTEGNMSPSTRHFGDDVGLFLTRREVGTSCQPIVFSANTLSVNSDVASAACQPVACFATTPSVNYGGKANAAHQPMACSANTHVDVAGNKTTVCFKNLPNNYNVADVEGLLEACGCASLYDFLYLPHDFRRLPARINLGYFFVNFESHEVAMRAWATLDGYNRWSVQSSKVLVPTWAKETQGLRACIKRYRTSPVMHDKIPIECKPLIWEQGKLVPLQTTKKSIHEPRQENGMKYALRASSDASLDAELVLHSLMGCKCADMQPNASILAASILTHTTAGETQAELSFVSSGSESPVDDAVGSAALDSSKEGSALMSANLDSDEEGLDSEVDSVGIVEEPTGLLGQVWVRNCDAPKCYQCEAAFTVTRRRHHCRACGQVYCAVCAPLAKVCSLSSLLKRPTFKRLCKACVANAGWASDAELSKSTKKTTYEIKNTFVNVSRLDADWRSSY